MARGCGAKRVCKSKCEKTRRFGPLFEGLMNKNGTPLWREAHLQVKMCKTPSFWPGAYDEEKVSDRRDRKVDTQSVDKLIDKLIGQLVSQSINQLLT